MLVTLFFSAFTSTRSRRRFPSLIEVMCHTFPLLDRFIIRQDDKVGWDQSSQYDSMLPLNIQGVGHHVKSIDLSAATRFEALSSAVCHEAQRAL